MVADDGAMDMAVSAGLGGQTRVWSLKDSRCSQILRCGYRGRSDHTRATVPWSLAAREGVVAVGCGSGTVEVWDLNTHEMTRLQPSRSAMDDQPPSGGITCLHMEGQSITAATSSGLVVVWTWENLPPRASLASRHGRGVTQAMGRASPTLQAMASHSVSSPPVSSPASVGGGEAAGSMSSQMRPSPAQHGHRRTVSGGRVVWKDTLATTATGDPVQWLLHQPRTSPAKQQQQHAPSSPSATRGNGGGSPPADRIRRSSDAMGWEDTGDVSREGGGGANAAPIKRFQRVCSQFVHKAAINVMVVTARFVVTASSDRTLKVFRRLDMTCQHTLHGHEGSINALAVFVDGGEQAAAGPVSASARQAKAGNRQVDRTLAASGSDDNTVRLWVRTHRTAGAVAAVLVSSCVYVFRCWCCRR